MKKNYIKYIFLILSLSLIGLIVFCYVADMHLFKKNIETDNYYHSAVPIELEFYKQASKFIEKKVDLNEQEVIAGVVPHHLLAADMIAEFYYNLEDKDYDTIVLLGPNHFGAGKANIITSTKDWFTPYGILQTDKELIKGLLEKNSNFKIEDDIFYNEHSINSEVSFIKKTFSEAKLIPLILRADIGQAGAQELAEELLSLSEEKNILVLASVDFSHGKNHFEAEKQDSNSITALKNLSLNNVYDLDVDSPASIFTLLSYVNKKNGSFQLLNNSNSALLLDDKKIENVTSYVTGYFYRNKKEEKQTEISDKPLNLLFFGDMMLDRYVGEKIKEHGVEYIFEKMASSSYVSNGDFTGYDLVGGNLEGAVTNGGEHYLPVNLYDFAFTPDIVAEFKKYGFNFFNLANNHFADQGENGIIETRKNLENKGFFYVGCQDRKVGDCSFKVVHIKDKRIGLAGFSMVYGTFDRNLAEDIVKKLASTSELVIINVHWGVEYEHEPNETQRQVAHYLIDAGADIIIGHHPHVVQGMEVYKNAPIFYSLGNFIFDQYFSVDAQKGLAVAIQIDKDEVLLEFKPFKTKLSQIEFMREMGKKEFLNEFFVWSFLTEECKKEIIDEKFKLNKNDKIF